MGQTREKIISAAVNEIAKEGFESASVKRITQTAGVATGTIYNYFPSKKDLMFALLQEIGSAHCAYIAEQILQEQDYALRVKGLFEAGFGFVKENPLKARVLFNTLQGPNIQFKTHLSQIYQPMFQIINDDILIPGMQQGVFQSLDPVSTTLMIMTFYLGIGSTVNENGEPPFNLQDVAAFVLRGLGAKPHQGMNK
jgi:AcrR family transcriptional regulator